ncbi:MAG: bifunctional riboflavin kinase/FAD synthetase [Calditerrivibrio sp.]|nr:bifunctional riboflavin kinase/FAD synthetase [Calditerrivibrio sp.]MCA1932919.1 bifunctional riboflavin kinase/FAD synthetase [Calditerrivibrio sp.]
MKFIMEFVKGIENFHTDVDTSLTIGNFDGIHIGHSMIINKTVECAKKNNLKSLVITFSPHPTKFFGYDLKLLMTIEKKNRILADMGVDYHLVLDFNKELMAMDPEVFIRELLSKKFRGRFIVVGYDYRFGSRRKGDFELLKLLANKYSYTAYKFDKVVLDDITVSSSNIRKLILEGNMSLANRMLGRYYSIDGVVNRGDGIGKLLAFPTANITIGECLIPKFGVYATIINIDGVLFNSVTNVGVRPTIPEKNELRVETHIFDYDGNIYGKMVELMFVEYLREEMKFSDFDMLKKAIENDCISAKKILENM